MTKVSRYGKPHGVRFIKDVEKALLALCKKREVNESNIIQEAVECYLLNPKCVARRRKSR
jgi:hypothetical protein